MSDLATLPGGDIQVSLVSVLVIMIFCALSLEPVCIWSSVFKERVEGQFSTLACPNPWWAHMLV